MKHLTLLIAAFALAITQCERHSWEDVKDEHGHITEKGTKRLFEEHAGEGADQHGKEGTGHDKDAEAPAKDAEKKEDAAHDQDGDGQTEH